MSLARVEVTQEVLLAMLSHAHSTEAEEVMGLLMGDILEDGASGAVCRVSLAIPHIRTDRRRDRVECSPEQMAQCSTRAEHLSIETGIRIRIVGWYHSHPHITVLPSHVDIRTQAMYQLLDPGFVGLIVSTFNRDAASQFGAVQLTAFQSLPAGGHHDLVSGRGPLVTPVEFSIKKEVDVVVVPSSQASLLKRHSFSDSKAVVQMLLLEEAGACEEASTADGFAAGGSSSASLMRPCYELAGVHHAAVYQAHLSRIVETALHPTLMSMMELVAQQQLQAIQLHGEVAYLERCFAADTPGAQLSEHYDVYDTIGT
ncbi:hypothetical protein Agub_g10710 [Astrephomene gubernaculifera]|uniref:MPN domain-containing protein n=1 Tax=Astrephomene gubernaculifera TaxID=47775 RepID=A0AAD3DX42_9CHLO|nr:hypothetical protein Agub_g10710 [Astrephomene gubernaculifera]